MGRKVTVALFDAAERVKVRAGFPAIRLVPDQGLPMLSKSTVLAFAEEASAALTATCSTTAKL
jgi:hypothetical protein